MMIIAIIQVKGYVWICSRFIGCLAALHAWVSALSLARMNIRVLGGGSCWRTRDELDRMRTRVAHLGHGSHQAPYGISIQTPAATHATPAMRATHRPHG